MRLPTFSTTRSTLWLLVIFTARPCQLARSKGRPGQYTHRGASQPRPEAAEVLATSLIRTHPEVVWQLKSDPSAAVSRYMTLALTADDGLVMTARSEDTTKVWTNLSLPEDGAEFKHGRPRELRLSASSVLLRQPEDAAHNLGWFFQPSGSSSEGSLHLYGGRGPCTTLGVQTEPCNMALNSTTNRTNAGIGE